MSATSSTSGSGGRPRRCGGGLWRMVDRCWRLTPSASATAVTGHPRATRSSAAGVFWACGAGYGLAEQLILHDLLAQQALQLAHLGFQRAVLGRWHHLLAGCSRGERALVHQPAPGEDLAAADAVPAGNERHAHTRQVRLLDDPHLLLRCPAPPALDTGKDLAIVVTPGHTVSHMPHSYLRAGPCQVI